MLAVMEYLDNDKAKLKECARLLRPGGGLLIIVPSWYAKPAPEFMSYRPNLVNPAEIRYHKRYCNKEALGALVRRVGGLQMQDHAYLQWKFNNKVFVYRTSEG